MKTKKLIPVFCLASVLFSSLATSCSSSTTSDVVNPTLFSAYSTVKVTQNKKESEYFTRLDPKIDIAMMKNETESGQIFINPDIDVSYYDLTLSDLKHQNGSLISKDNIKAYSQQYLEISSKFNKLNTDFVSGDYVPDFLLPMDKTVSYGRNKIKAGNNQGITIDIETDHNTKAGVYRGEFILKLNKQEFNIPVSVTVWDIDLDSRSKLQSCFLIYSNYLLQGEMNSNDDLKRNYFDMLLDYKVNSMYIDNGNSPITHTDEYIKGYVDEMAQHYKNENFNSLCIPYMFHGYHYGKSDMTNVVYKYIKYIVLASTEEDPLIDYAYFYGSQFDEADLYDDLYAQSIEFYKKGGDYERLLDYCANKLVSEKVLSNFSPSFKEHVLDTVRNIPNVFTNTKYLDKTFEDSIATPCPLLSVFDDNINEQKLSNFTESKENESIWTYTCSGPLNPYPTFHLDDYNLGTRMSGWMMKNYKINGYLYWAVNLYERVAKFGSLDVFVDPYTSPYRAGECPGDGFLVYPGAYYGSNTPFPSMRLLAYRDGNDDYDMLSLYETLLNEKASEYEIDINFNDYVRDIYDSLFEGSVYIQNDELIEKARLVLAERILSLQNEDGLMLHSKQVGNENEIDIYTSSSTLSINDESIIGEKSGKGYHYKKVLSSSTHDVKVNASFPYTFSFTSSNYLVEYTDPQSIYSVSDKSSASFSSESVDVNIKSKYVNEEGLIDGATKRFVPYFALLNDKFDDVDYIEFNITNNDLEAQEINLNLSSSSSDETIGGIYLLPQETKSIRVNLKQVLSGTKASATQLVFAFSNVETDDEGKYKLCDDRNFTLSKVTVIKGGN